MRRVLLYLSIAFSLASSSPAQRTSRNRDIPIDPQAPLQAELLAPVDVGKLSVGASVFAKARVDWNQPTCHLRMGSMVVGHVVELEKHSKQNTGSCLTISFDHADCDGHLVPFQFTLFALISPPQIEEGSTMVDRDGLFGSVSARPVKSLGGGMTPPPPPLNLNNDATISSKNSDSGLPKVIQRGQVIGLKKVTLSVGTGPDGASVLTSLKNNVRLEGATQLVLMPRHVLPPAPAADTAQPILIASATPPAAEPVPAPIAPLPPERDETSICTAPCSMVPASAGIVSANASLSVSTALFGFVPHDSHEFSAFDYQSTLIYLDPQNLLFTYDPHKLRQRFPAGVRTESMRTIRAVLLDPATLKIKKIIEWRVQGEGQFLWSAASGQILVHQGHHLRLLGTDLNVLRETSVPGQLVFVSISPSGDYIAIGTLHERHSPAIHEQLAQDLHMEPEEDIDVQLFDQNFTPLLDARQSSSLPPPVLSNEGEIRVNSTGRNRWRIHEFRWDHTSRVIASITSDCHPNLATPLPGSVFLVGCSNSPMQNWYRLLRLDGRPILNGHGSSEEIEQSSASSNQDYLAVRVVRAHFSKARGGRFKKQDLKEQEVSVYRASDGKRLFFFLNPDVSLAEQSFALSPDGTQLAILSGLNISLYPIAKATP